MQCDEQLLRTLVDQQADPDERSMRIYRHVGGCHRCQQVLEKLGGGPPWEREIAEALTSEASAGISGERAEAARPQHADAGRLPIDLRFLSPPSHPEMLGKLGRYEIESVIGRGGMGLVLRGYDPELQRTVAIKVLAPEWAACPAARQRFGREAQAAASVAHENVIPIHNVQSDGQLPFLVMRFVPGESLERYVSEHGVPDPETILRIAAQLAAGLSAAHRQGLIHRDVKPANVLVGENVERVWLTDFGLARAADDVRMTRTGVIAGTPHYMSPEQARGQPLDARSDLFSLGCLLYFLCAGRPPFDASTTLGVLHDITTTQPVLLSRVRSDLPPKLITLIERLLAKKASRRPATAERVGEELRLAGAQLKRGLPTRRQKMRRKILYGTFGILVFLSVLLTAIPLILLPDPPGGSSQMRRATVHHQPAATVRRDAAAIDEPWDHVSVGVEPGPQEQARLKQIVEQIDAMANWNDARWQTQVGRFEETVHSLDQPLDWHLASP